MNQRIGWGFKNSIMWDFSQFFAITFSIFTELNHKVNINKLRKCNFIMDIIFTIRFKNIYWYLTFSGVYYVYISHFCIPVNIYFWHQGLLLHGSLPEEDQDGSVTFGENRVTTEQQLVRHSAPSLLAREGNSHFLLWAKVSMSGLLLWWCLQP